MIVITQNGTTRVYTGWRAWLLAAVVSMAVFLVFVTVSVLLLGFAVSVGLLLMLLVPTVLVVAAISALLGQRPIE